MHMGVPQLNTHPKVSNLGEGIPMEERSTSSGGNEARWKRRNQAPPSPRTRVIPRVVVPDHRSFHLHEQVCGEWTVLGSHDPTALNLSLILGSIIQHQPLGFVGRARLLCRASEARSTALPTLTALTNVFVPQFTALLNPRVQLDFSRPLPTS